MDEIYYQLATQIQTLVRQHQTLQHAYNQLAESQTALSRENKQLLVKHQTAIHQIETMVSRLKSRENIL